MSDTERKTRQLNKKKKRRRIIAVVLVIIVAVYARNIIKLQIEGHELKKENQNLTEQRDKLKIELKNVNSKEYIQNRARQQLRLVNPDEILFVFPDDEDEKNKQ